MLTQELFVIKQLKANKKIDRNTCLRNYITRLGAIIYTLKKRGYEFSPEYDERHNYVYHLIKAPK